jgi:hypothetical protein
MQKGTIFSVSQSSQMKKRKWQLRGNGKEPLRAGGWCPKKWSEDRPCNHAGPFMVTASIAGTHLGSGGHQGGSPLAQDLRLIRTRPEKSVGCDYRGSYIIGLYSIQHCPPLKYHVTQMGLRNRHDAGMKFHNSPLSDSSTITPQLERQAPKLDKIIAQQAFQVYVDSEPKSWARTGLF